MMEIDVEEIRQKAAAVSPQLVEVLRRIGDEQFLAVLAQSMGPMSILGGKNIIEVFQGLVGEGKGAGDTLTSILAGFTAGKTGNSG